MTSYIQLDENGLGVNLIEVDDPADVILPDGHVLTPYQGPWGVGWKWDGSALIDPTPPPPPPPPPKPAEPNFDG